MTTASSPTLAPWASSLAQNRIAELRSQPNASGADAVVTDVTAAIRKHHAVSERQGLPLYAGSNILSPRVLGAHDGTIGVRPALGLPGEKLQPGMGGIEKLEVLAAEQLQRAFRSRYAEARYLTATMANLGAYIAFAQPGDTVAILAPNNGSHASHQENGTAGVRGLRTAHLPYDVERFDVNHSKLNILVDTVRPAIILVGGSVILFPHDIAPLRDAADRVGAKLMFDASHVAGLIAAGVFPNPLDAGVDVMTFSTYKTLGGPAGGASVTNDAEVAEKMAHAIYPVLSSNYDAARLGPLAVAAAEAVEQSPPWAQTTVALAQHVAGRLDAAGMAVVGRDRGYTTTHQVVIDVRRHGGGLPVMRQLEELGIQVGSCRLPDQNPTDSPGGIRLGSQEVVRRGARLAHADAIADLIARAVRAPHTVTFHDAQEVRRSFGADLWGR